MPDDSGRITLDLPADDRPPPLAFDPRCEDLARVFLMDEPDVTEATVALLASQIQHSIEEWLEDRRAQVRTVRR